MLDIKAKAPFPAGWLSNFVAYRFVMDGVTCASMEGFLQSLKVENQEEQRRICSLVGADAQKAGRRHDWTISGALWWRGEAIDRFSSEYQVRRALAATGTAELAHRSGKSDPLETILTEAEFCSRLTALRRRLAPGGEIA